MQAGELGWLTPGQQQMLARALARARAAGVPEWEIEQAVRQEFECRDAFTASVVCGVLANLTRQRGPRTPPGESPFVLPEPKRRRVGDGA
jgi:hypothetical protein